MNARFKSLMGHITENICILKVYSRGKDFLGHVSFAKKADKVFLVPKKGIKFISTHKKKKKKLDFILALSKTETSVEGGMLKLVSPPKC